VYLIFLNRLMLF